MSFLVSDGLYFGEGLIDKLQSDGLAGPFLKAAGELLLAVAGKEQDPEASLPDGSRVADLAAAVDGGDGVRRRQDVSLELPS